MLRSPMCHGGNGPAFSWNGPELLAFGVATVGRANTYDRGVCGTRGRDSDAGRGVAREKEPLEEDASGAE